MAASGPANTFPLAAMQAEFVNVPPEPAAQGAGWSAMWDAVSRDPEGRRPPFDRGLPNPALAEALAALPALLADSASAATTTELGTGKRALVPGCGRGYDVLLLAAYGFEAWGLEVSAIAREAARAEARREGREERYPVRAEGGSVGFLLGDFFDAKKWEGKSESAEVGEWKGVGRGFDLIYDYTFLCALPVALRPRWAATMVSLLAPGGTLICLEFPLYKELSVGGPPFGLQAEVYEAALQHPGAEIVYDDKSKVVLDKSSGSHLDGLQKLARWKPAKTHEIGEGTDHVSMWKKKDSA